jgi:hydroxymethylglutaryl-CoA reductase
LGDLLVAGAQPFLIPIVTVKVTLVAAVTALGCILASNNPGSVEVEDEEATRDGL